MQLHGRDRKKNRKNWEDLDVKNSYTPLQMNIGIQKNEDEIEDDFPSQTG